MDIKAILEKMSVKEKAYQLLQLNTLAYSVDKGVVKITGPVAQDEIDNVKTVICRDVCDNIDIHPKEKDILSDRIAKLLK